MSTFPSPPRRFRLSLVHDFLIQMGGAEKVVEVMAEAYPEAKIYTSATFGENLFPVFRSPRVRNSWMNWIPGMQRLHKKLFFLYPFAFKSMDIVESDVAWISSSSFSKWIPKPAGTKFVCYCHIPPRYFWNPDEYLENEIGNRLLRRFVCLLMPTFRRSDLRQSRKVDLFLANSRNVQKRIRECYGRDSIVVYPPVDVERFQVSRRSEDFYLIVSRLVAYKQIDRAVRAFTKSGKKLVIIGDGPDRKRLESIAGSSVTFLGRAPDDVVTEMMATCRAYVFPGSEDFGITPVEAQACGKPVIAFRHGGALETVIDGRTGVFFDSGETESLVEAVERFEEMTWDAGEIRRNAERFSVDRFLEETRSCLERIAAEAQSEAPVRRETLLRRTPNHLVSVRLPGGMG
jgi:glycosyltransferase involved in cell wall biosynthesis